VQRTTTFSTEAEPHYEYAYSTYRSIQKIDIQKGKQGYAHIVHVIRVRSHQLVQRFDIDNLFEVFETCVAEGVVREICHGGITKPAQSSDEQNTNEKGRFLPVGSKERKKRRQREG
jgi:hypothetical protein